MKFLRSCLIFLGLTSGVFLCVGGAAAFFLTRLPASVQNLPPAVTSTEKALALEDKLNQFSQQLEDASTSGERTQVSLAITEDEANSLIAKDLESFQEQNPGVIPLRVESLQVSFLDGKVLAAAVVDLAVLHPHVAMTAEVGVQGGEPSVRVESISLGRLPTPLLGPALEGYIGQALQSAVPSDLPLFVDAIRITNGQLVLEGWNKPATSIPAG